MTSLEQNRLTATSLADLAVKEHIRFSESLAAYDSMAESGNQGNAQKSI